MMWPKPDPASMNAFYGNPDVNGDGQPDLKWEAQNIISVKPPYKMFWSWGPEVKNLRVHRRCWEALSDVLSNIADEYNAKDREYYNLDKTGGVYNFRLMRGSSAKLSIHSWGAAIDLAPVQNGLGKRWSATATPPMIPLDVVAMFEKRGAKWGGRWKRPDSMHLEFTS